jgi:hypothetical protein
MEFICKVGNLKIYYEFASAWEVVLYAINGADVVARELFAFSYFNLDRFVALMLQRNFDIYTIADIRAGLVNIKREYNGALLSGQLAGFSSTEYFKRIDDTKYYKHFTHRPMMPKEETA